MDELYADGYWWGLYMDGWLSGVIKWDGQYPPSIFSFGCFVSTEIEYTIVQVHVTPI